MGFLGPIVERFFIYFPEKRLVADPSSYGLDFEDAHLMASDGVDLHGWFVPGQSDITLLWFHGNAGNIGHRLDNLNLFHRALKVNIFILSYRGYGRSGGRPTEKGTYRDAEAALDYLLSRDDVDADRIIYFGRSLGGAVAVHLAVQHEPYALILDSSFDSVTDMARRQVPFLPVWPLLKGMYDCVANIGRVNAPVLVLHGDRDEIVPNDVGERLFDAANDPKQLFTIEGAGHNDTYLVGGQEYVATLKRFLDGLSHP